MSRRTGSTLDVGVLVGGVVVHHQVQLAVGMGTGDLLEERQELLVPVAGLARRGDLLFAV
jgi:hypothetical protein